MRPEPLKLWYVMTPAGRAGPYLNAAAAHDAADPLGLVVFSLTEEDDEEEDEELDDGVLGYEDREGGYDSDYADE